MNDSNDVSDLPHLASPASTSTPNPSSTASATVVTGQVADVNAFIIYLKQLLPALLDSSLASMGEFEKCASEKSNIDVIKKFIGESQVRTLIIQKLISKGKIMLLGDKIYFGKCQRIKICGDFFL